MASPFIDMTVAAKTKDPEIAKDTGTILKSISRGKVLSLTDIKGNGLILFVM